MLRIKAFRLEISKGTNPCLFDVKKKFMPNPLASGFFFFFPLENWLLVITVLDVMVDMLRKDELASENLSRPVPPYENISKTM